MRTKSFKTMFLPVSGLIALLILLSYVPSLSVSSEDEKIREGVLETDDISVILQGGGLWIRITPMEDEILRYCTQDTRNTYSKMLENQGGAFTKEEEKEFVKFLVLFQGRSENEIYFEPTELNLNHQGKLYKSVKIVPISSTFDKRILTLYGNPEMAIYAFNKEVDLSLPIQFKYKELESQRWTEIIKTVEDSKLLVR